MYVYYIRANHSLAASSFSKGGWHDSSWMFKDLTAYTSDPATHSLAVASFNATGSAFEMIVLLERPGGNVSALHGLMTLGDAGNPPDILLGTPINSTGGSIFTVNWRDLSENLYLTPDSNRRLFENGTEAPYSPPKYSAPFVAGTIDSYPGDAKNVTLYMLDQTGHWGNESSVCVIDLAKDPNTYFAMGTFNSLKFFEIVNLLRSCQVRQNFLRRDPLSIDLESLRVSDFVVPYVFEDGSPSPLIGIWVNEGALNLFLVTGGGSLDMITPSPFPFTYLATTTPVNSSAFYLYHQVNGTTLIEDVWDIVPGGWSESNNFNVEVE